MLPASDQYRPGTGNYTRDVNRSSLQSELELLRHCLITLILLVILIAFGLSQHNIVGCDGYIKCLHSLYTRSGRSPCTTLLSCTAPLVSVMYQSAASLSAPGLPSIPSARSGPQTFYIHQSSAFLCCFHENYDSTESYRTF